MLQASSTPAPFNEPAMPQAAHPARALSSTATGLLAALLLCTGPAGASDKPASAADTGFSAGLSVQPSTTFEKLGLPGYPGATLYVEPGEEGQKASASVGVNLGFFGVQVNAMKLRSSDSAQTVAAWYREQLARLGPVLDCSANGPADAPPLADKKADKQVLRCGKDRAKPGAALFKLGHQQAQRVVAIQPLGAGGTKLTLVRVETRGAD